MPKRHHDMPDPDNLEALADWINQDALEMINAVLQKSMVGILKGVRERFERDRRWVPVTEKLPEQFMRVIIYSEKRGVECGHIMADRWSSESGASSMTVTHWMPLPTSPK